MKRIYFYTVPNVLIWYYKYYTKGVSHTFRSAKKAQVMGESAANEGRSWGRAVDEGLGYGVSATSFEAKKAAYRRKYKGRPVHE